MKKVCFSISAQRLLATLLDPLSEKKDIISDSDSEWNPKEYEEMLLWSYGDPSIEESKIVIEQNLDKEDRLEAGQFDDADDVEEEDGQKDR